MNVTTVILMNRYLTINHSEGSFQDSWILIISSWYCWWECMHLLDWFIHKNWPVYYMDYSIICAFLLPSSF